MTFKNWLRWVRFLAGFLCLNGCYLYTAEPVDEPAEGVESVKFSATPVQGPAKPVPSLSAGCLAVDTTRPHGYPLTWPKPAPGCLAHTSIGAWCCP